MRGSIPVAAGLALTAVLVAPATAAVGPTPQTSTTFAGYAMAKHAAVHSASARFTVSRTICHAHRSGVAPAVLLRGHAGLVGAAVAVVCRGGRASYRTVLLMNGHQHNAFGVGPGEVVGVTVNESSSRDRAHVQITDLTTGQHAVINGARHPMNSAQVGDETVISTPASAIDRFAPTHFTAVHVNGRPLDASRAFGFNRVHRGVVQIRVGGLHHHGTSFTLTFAHAG